MLQPMQYRQTAFSIICRIVKNTLHQKTMKECFLQLKKVNSAARQLLGRVEFGFNFLTS